MIPTCSQEFEKLVCEIKLSMLSLFSPDSYYPHSTCVILPTTDIHTPDNAL